MVEPFPPLLRDEDKMLQSADQAEALCQQAAPLPAPQAQPLYQEALAHDPQSINALCGMAGCLEASGHLDAAMAFYQRVLSLAPQSPLAANNLGNLLQKLERFDEAVAAYRIALGADPGQAAIRVNLGRALDSSGHSREALEEFGQALALDPQSAEIHYRIGSVLENIPFLADARAYYERAVALDSSHAAAQIALGNVLADFGEEELAWEHRRLGYADRILTTRPARQNDHPIRVLLLSSAAGGNLPLSPVLTPEQYQTSSLMVEFVDQLPPLDQYDVIVNAIGDADRSLVGLQVAQRLLANCPARVINPPDRVLETRRESISAKLAPLPDVRTPRIKTLPRASFETGQAIELLRAEGWGYPLLLRVLGHHTGHHFVQIDSFDQMAEAARDLPGPQITAIEWLDAYGADGYFRKYRMLFLGGKLFPLHLALSKHWKVHYFSANMADDAAFREEEMRFLSDSPAVIGAKGMAALQNICDALGLDYAGIDFAVGPTGEILLFEANANMRISLPSANPLWDYRRPFFADALTAARQIFQP